MQDSVRELLGRRKNRAIAIILTVKENQCDPYLSDDASYKLRKVVLDQLNEFHDFCCDLLESFDSPDVVINDLWLQKIDDIYNYIQELDEEGEYANN